MSKAICRACLDPGGKGFITMNENWKQKYASCIGFKVFPKYVPLMLCQKCADLIDQYYKFKKVCLANEEIWQASNSNILENKPFIDRDDLKIGYPGSFDESTVNYIVNRNSVKKISKLRKKIHSAKSNGNVNSAKKMRNAKSAKKNDNDDVSAENDENSMDVNSENISQNEFNPHDLLSVKVEAADDDKPISTTSTSFAIPTEEQMELAQKERLILYEKSKFSSLLDSLIKYQCGLCKFEATRRFEVAEHLQQHLESNMLDCKLCDYHGRDFADMLYHRPSHVPDLETNYGPCLFCPKICKDPLTAVFHFRKDHLNQERGGWCEVCGKKYRRLDVFKAHIYLHNDIWNFECDHCGMNPSHVPTLEPNYGPCLFCPKICKDPLTAVFHFRKVHLNQEEGGWCEVCSKKYKNWEVFRAHVNLHNDIWNFECDYCGMKFYQKNQIVLHMKSHTLHGSYMCDICGKGLRTAFSLKQHQNIHFARTPVKCDHCNKTFKGQTLLDKHMKELKRERKFTCSHCGKSYVSKHKLEIHNISHTDVRPVQCEICHKYFKGQSNYRYHVKTVHKQTGGFECKVCGKKVLLKENLIEHYNEVHKIDNEEIEKMQGILEVF